MTTGKARKQAETREKSLPCQCGHSFGAHEHYRKGTDCSACECSRFRPDREKRAS